MIYVSVNVFKVFCYLAVTEYITNRSYILYYIIMNVRAL